MASWERYLPGKAEEMAKAKQAKVIDDMIRATMPRGNAKRLVNLAEKTGISKHTLWARMYEGGPAYGKWSAAELGQIAKALKWTNEECAKALGRTV